VKAVVIFLFCGVLLVNAQTRLTPGIEPFIAYHQPVIALTHARVIDGTGAEPLLDQTIVINHGRIQSVGSSVTARVPDGAALIDLTSKTVIPGIVGMHEHLFYPADSGTPLYTEVAVTFPRLYLAAGVTTARTAGSVEPFTDLEMKKLIDAGKAPGPNLLITIGYLEGAGSFTPQMHELSGPEDATRFVNYWASQGAHSFKAYMHITHAELDAAIQAAHALHLKVAGHLCSVGFREAAALGIDSLEHGIVTDAEFLPNKQTDVCGPVQLEQLDVQAEPVQQMIRDLVAHHVAVTSTLAVFESAPPLQQRFLDALSPTSLNSYLARRAQQPPNALNLSMKRVHKEMEFERAFVAAGGLLMAGADPTGNGSTLAGFGDQRNIQLLVDAGFKPMQAIQIATLNGARSWAWNKRLAPSHPVSGPTWW
jgi:imidazolonepropionase-like amidohydrolase